MKTSLTTSSLTQEVKQVTSLVLNQGKIFSAADMWNIERRKKSRIQRRFYL